MIALTLTAPQAYEANPGIVQGVAPRGTTAAARAGRRPLRARAAADERAARLPARADRAAAARSDAHGRGAGRHARARLGDGRARLRPAGGRGRGRAAADDRRRRAARASPASRLSTGVASAAWVRDLASGSTAAYNAGAHFPAASTIKLAILLGVLARDSTDPRALVVLAARARARADSSNRAANALLPRAGGAAAVDARGPRARRDRARSRAAATCSRPASARIGRRGVRRPLPPTTVVDQPTFPCCKYTTAHDLGTLLVSLMLASTGHGPALRHGITAREARVALWLLVHAGYPGLVRPASPFPVGHKAGWLPDIQHDAALVFSPRGTLVAVFMNYSPGGVSYTRVRDAAGDVVRLALRAADSATASSPASAALPTISSRLARSVRPPLRSCRRASTNGVIAGPRTPCCAASASASSISGSTSSRLGSGGRASATAPGGAEVPVRARHRGRLVGRLDARGDGRPARGRVEQRQRVRAIAEHRDAERLQQLAGRGHVEQRLDATGDDRDARPCELAEVGRDVGRSGNSRCTPPSRRSPSPRCPAGARPRACRRRSSRRARPARNRPRGRAHRPCAPTSRHRRSAPARPRSARRRARRRGCRRSPGTAPAARTAASDDAPDGEALALRKAVGDERRLEAHERRRRSRARRRPRARRASRSRQRSDPRHAAGRGGLRTLHRVERLALEQVARRERIAGARRVDDAPRRRARRAATTLAALLDGAPERAALDHPDGARSAPRRPPPRPRSRTRHRARAPPRERASLTPELRRCRAPSRDRRSREHRSAGPRAASRSAASAPGPRSSV